MQQLLGGEPFAVLMSPCHENTLTATHLGYGCKNSWQLWRQLEEKTEAEVYSITCKDTLSIPEHKEKEDQEDTQTFLRNQNSRLKDTQRMF